MSVNPEVLQRTRTYVQQGFQPEEAEQMAHSELGVIYDPEYSVLPYLQQEQQTPPAPQPSPSPEPSPSQPYTQPSEPVKEQPPPNPFPVDEYGVEHEEQAGTGITFEPTPPQPSREEVLGRPDVIYDTSVPKPIERYGSITPAEKPVTSAFSPLGGREDTSARASTIANMGSQPLTSKQQAQVQAIIGTPEGMELVGTKEVLSPFPSANWGVTPKKETVAYYVPKGTFDKTLYSLPIIGNLPFARASTPVEKELFKQQTLEHGYVHTESERSVWGGLVMKSMVVIPAVISPVIAAGAIAGVAVGTGVKATLTGQPLTDEEIFISAGIGEVVAVGVQGVHKGILQPKVSERLSASYKSAAESGKLWEPSPSERIAMKLTGARPHELATGIVDVPLPTQRIGGNLAVDYGVGIDAFDVGVAPRSSSYLASNIPSGLRGGLATYSGVGLTVIPQAMEVYRMPSEQKTLPKPEPATKTINAGGDTVEVWAKQPPKNLYDTISKDYDSGSGFDVHGLNKEAGRLDTMHLTITDVPSAKSSVQEISATKGMTPLREFQYGTRNFYQQSKQVTQLRYGAAWGEGLSPQQTRIILREPSPTTSIPAVAVNPTVVTQKPKQEPLTAIGVSVTSQQPSKQENPFTGYGGRSYYPQRQRIVEDVEQQEIAYPTSSPLPSPPRVERVEIVTTTPKLDIEEGTVGSTPPKVGPMFTFTPSDLITPTPTQPDYPELRSIPEPQKPQQNFLDIVTPKPDVGNTPDLVQSPIVVPIQTPIQPQIQTPWQEPKETPIQIQDYHQLPTLTRSSFMPPRPSGFKFEDFGSDRRGQHPAFGLYGSKRRRYPFMSPEQFLLSPGKKKSKKHILSL